MIALDGGFTHTRRALRSALLHAPCVDVGEWHSQSVKGIPQLVTRELQDVSLAVAIPQKIEGLQDMVEPNLPWAEKHFQERVSGEPLNPPPSAAEWPYAQAGHDAHTDDGGKFSHTYPERFWPREAGDWAFMGMFDPLPDEKGAHGIRYEYGDLMDVVNMLHRSPMSRQAYLPVWFPEDTGATQKQRVPCSLGYHFMIRNNRVSITYMIRSCDFVRHFNDDVYMAARLCQWVRDQLVERDGPDDIPVPQSLEVGTLTMHTMSMHIFEGDVAKLGKEL